VLGTAVPGARRRLSGIRSSVVALITDWRRSWTMLRRGRGAERKGREVSELLKELGAEMLSAAGLDGLRPLVGGALMVIAGD